MKAAIGITLIVWMSLVLLFNWVLTGLGIPRNDFVEFMVVSLLGILCFKYIPYRVIELQEKE